MTLTTSSSHIIFPQSLTSRATKVEISREPPALMENVTHEQLVKTYMKNKSYALISFIEKPAENLPTLKFTSSKNIPEGVYNFFNSPRYLNREFFFDGGLPIHIGSLKISIPEQNNPFTVIIKFNETKKCEINFIHKHCLNQEKSVKGYFEELQKLVHTTKYFKHLFEKRTITKITISDIQETSSEFTLTKNTTFLNIFNLMTLSENLLLIFKQNFLLHKCEIKSLEPLLNLIKKQGINPHLKIIDTTKENENVEYLEGERTLLDQLKEGITYCTVRAFLREFDNTLAIPEFNDTLYILARNFYNPQLDFDLKYKPEYPDKIGHLVLSYFTGTPDVEVIPNDNHPLQLVLQKTEEEKLEYIKRFFPERLKNSSIFKIIFSYWHNSPSKTLSSLFNNNPQCNQSDDGNSDQVIEKFYRIEKPPVGIVSTQALTTQEKITPKETPEPLKELVDFGIKETEIQNLKKSKTSSSLISELCALGTVLFFYSSRYYQNNNTKKSKRKILQHQKPAAVKSKILPDKL